MFRLQITSCSNTHFWRPTTIRGMTKRAFSIIAVHGLGGHAYKTWTAENGTMWLKDLLPQAIPGARIMTFGYDSEAQTSRYLTHRTLYSNADNLISDLCSLRQDTKTVERPIIFLGHSLGGLVIKSALVRASIYSPNGREDSGTIKDSTNGIVFFGTPHRGSRDVSWGKTIRNIASIDPSKERLLNSLEKESDWLEMQLEQFKSLSIGLSNFCCYESLKTTRPRFSARVKLPTKVHETFR